MAAQLPAAVEQVHAGWAARGRKALAAAGTAFLTTLGASLWQAASGSGVTEDEIAGSIGLAVSSALAVGLATWRATNAGQLDLRQLQPHEREAVRAALLGPKPAR